MTPSKYNYIVPFGEHTMFFNGISEAFFCVPKERTATYETIINNPDDNNETFAVFIDKMKKQGFVLENETDETELVRQKFEGLTRPWEYYLMVLPTYQCNLRCWYCVQKHDDKWMTDEMANSVKKLIVNKLADDKITHFHLSWFGGEPLLAYKKVLDLTIFARDYCKEHGKTFSCAITTNATLLNPKRIEALREAGVTSYQITIDGDRATHDSIKVLALKSAYDKSLANVDAIARHTHCTLRFNYTHENLKPEAIINDLKERISAESLKNMRFMIYKVWQEDKDNIVEEEVDKLFRLGAGLGMQSRLMCSGLCYADQKHFDCVWPDGHVGKCDNQAPDTTPGQLNTDGSIAWQIDNTLVKPRLFEEVQSECNQCRYLPLCWGPCVAKREPMLQAEGKIKCMYLDKDTEMAVILSNIRKSVMQTINI